MSPTSDFPQIYMCSVTPLLKLEPKHLLIALFHKRYDLQENRGSMEFTQELQQPHRGIVYFYS